MAVWSTILIEIWKRRQNEIAHLWNMKSFKGDEPVRYDYKSDYIIDYETQSVKEINIVKTYFRRIFGEIPIVSLSIAIVVALFVGND
jgi:hypothetical protein